MATLPLTTIHPKVSAATLGSSISAIAVWVAETAYHKDIPTSVAVAITTVVAAVAGYLAPGLVSDGTGADANGAMPPQG